MAAPRCLITLALCAALAACSGPSAPAPDGGAPDAGPPPGSPGPPALTATSTVSPAAVHLAWTPADALASSFEVSRADGPGPFVQIATLSAGATSYADESVAPGTAYAYRVTASDSAGVGAPSNELDLLAAPSDVSAGGSDTRVVVVWGAIANAGSYDVYRASAGGLVLLGNTASQSFLDDGQAQPIVAGQSYAYQVVARSGGAYLASIGSNLAQASALGLDVTANRIFISDVGESAVSLAGSLALEARNVDGGPLLDDGGNPIFFQSLASGSAIVVPGVPRGTYAITVLGFDDYVVSAARALDFSQASLGREGVQPAGANSTISYDLTGLAPWSAPSDAGPSDALEELCVGAGDYAANLAADIATPPAAGATVFQGTETLGEDSDSNLIDADAGDALYLFQLHAQTSSRGVPYLAPAAGLSSRSFTTQDGSGTPLVGPLAALAPIAIDVDFPQSAYLDPAHAQLNPLATNFSQQLFLELEKGFAAHGWYSNQALADGLVVDIPQDGGAPAPDGGVEVDLGSLAWADPVAADWDSFALVQSRYDVPFQISFEDTSTTPSTPASGSITFTSTSEATIPLASNAFDNAALLPTLSAPRAPALNGASAFAAQSGLSPTSTLSWSPPALGAPVYYLVVIYSIAPEVDDDGTFVKDANGDYVLELAQVASFTTKDTRVSLAADLVSPGTSYFATIDAVSNSGPAGPIDATVSPYTLGEQYASAETVTATFSFASQGGARAPLAKQSALLRSTRAGPLAKGARVPRLPPR